MFCVRNPPNFQDKQPSQGHASFVGTCQLGWVEAIPQRGAAAGQLCATRRAPLLVFFFSVSCLVCHVTTAATYIFMAVVFVHISFVQISSNMCTCFSQEFNSASAYVH